MQTLKTFATDESGAVTVDWVVLTSAIVGLAIAIMVAIGNATNDLAEKISADISSRSVWTY